MRSVWVLMRDHACSSAVLSLWQRRLFPAQRVASPFFCSQPDAWFSRVNNTPLAPERGVAGARIGRQCSAWRNPLAVYLRRPLELLSAHAARGGDLRAVRAEGRFRRCRRLGPLLLRSVCVALQHLVFMRLLRKQLQHCDTLTPDLPHLEYRWLHIWIIFTFTACGLPIGRHMGDNLTSS